jgi:hypothetical protein
MIAAKHEDPTVLVRGAMIVQDQQGKNKFSRWFLSEAIPFEVEFGSMSSERFLSLGRENVQRLMRGSKSSRNLPWQSAIRTV